MIKYIYIYFQSRESREKDQIFNFILRRTMKDHKDNIYNRNMTDEIG